MKEFYNLGSGEKNLLCNNDSNKYDYDIDSYDFDLNRKNDSHITIVNLVKENSTVLDIGCATGLIGQSLKKYKECIVDGIEYDSEAYEIAKKKKVYRDIYNLSIVDSKDNLLKVITKKYDYIILADVLEHLVSPWEALINIYDMLKDDGKIIISLPNIANIDIIRALINDEFNYQPLGLLDNTHLRFFTKKSFIDMIKNMSKKYGVYYDIELTDSMHFTPPYHKDDTGLFSLLNIGNVKSEDFLILQHIFTLTKSNNKKIKVKVKETREDYFSIINKTIEDKKSEYNTTITNYENEIQTINGNYSNLENNYNELEAKYNKVVNSKGWKLLEKIRKVKNKVFKK